MRKLPSISGLLGKLKPKKAAPLSRVTPARGTPARAKWDRLLAHGKPPSLHMTVGGNEGGKAIPRSQFRKAERIQTAKSIRTAVPMATKADPPSKIRALAPDGMRPKAATFSKTKALGTARSFQAPKTTPAKSSPTSRQSKAQSFQQNSQPRQQQDKRDDEHDKRQERREGFNDRLQNKMWNLSVLGNVLGDEASTAGPPQPSEHFDVDAHEAHGGGGMGGGGGDIQTVQTYWFE